MNYSLNRFFDKTECLDIIEFCEKNGTEFSYNPKETWDCKRVYNDEFKEKIISKINGLYKNGEIIFWFNYADYNIRNINISLTKYYDGRFLDLHKDATSNYTTVICLTEDYQGGDFCLSQNLCGVEKSEIKIHLNIGEGITFEGNKTYHGVMPVHSGLRCALNIWTNDTDFSYYKLDTKKKII